MHGDELAMVCSILHADIQALYVCICSQCIHAISLASNHFVSQLWRKISCETKSGTESLGSGGYDFSQCPSCDEDATSRELKVLQSLVCI